MITSSGRAKTVLSVVATIAGCLAAAFLAMVLVMAFTAILSLVGQGVGQLFRTTVGKLLWIASNTLAAIVGGAYAIRFVVRLINHWSDPAYRIPRLPLARGIFSGIHREVPVAVSTLTSGVLAATLLGVASFNITYMPHWPIPTAVTLVMSLCMAAFGFTLGAIGWSSIVGDQNPTSTVGAVPSEPHITFRFRPWRAIGLVAVYYPLLFGPFMQLASLWYFNSPDGKLCNSLYAPMLWLLESGPPPFRQLLMFYLCFWVPAR
jgi:hypothetical protein